MSWEYKFQLLRQYKKVYGDCNVPVHYRVAGVNLGGWVATQRKEYRKLRAGMASQIVNEKRVARLERNGFSWWDNPSP